MRRKKIKLPAFQFKCGEMAIYDGGLYKQYTHQKCIVLERSKKNRVEYYRIQFDDGFSFVTVIKALRKDDIIDKNTKCGSI